LIASFPTKVSTCRARLAATLARIAFRNSEYAFKTWNDVALNYRPFQNFSAVEKQFSEHQCKLTKQQVKLKHCENKTCRMQIFGWIRCGDAPLYA